MNRSRIRNIIITATVLLIALVVTQVTWVKKAYEIEQKQFSYDVTQALLRTLRVLQAAEGDSSIILDPIDQEKPNLFVVRVHYSSDPFLLQSLLEMEFRQSAIQEDFVFNIYDCFSDSVVYCKKIHANSNTKAEIPKVLWNKDQGHYFSVFFPGHSNGLFYQMEFWMYSSIILVVIIGFFGYIIAQMLRQRRLSEMKTDFINNMTHEFKTPISTISIAVDALKKPNISEKPERIEKYSSIIQTENHRLQDQVERILQAATIEKEKVSIKNQPVAINELLAEIIPPFKMNIESKSGILETHFNAENSTIMGDTAHLKNIFNNLIDNGIKYSTDELHLTISTKNVGTDLVITFEDRGIGIAKEHQAHIFEKFYRVPTGNIHDVKGFGIGLNYVSLLVKKHKGTLSLQSTIGKGSIFSLTFKTV